MRVTKKKTWSSPEIKRFENANELWEHYQSKGTPEQKTRLRAMLDIVGRRETEAKLRRSG